MLVGLSPNTVHQSNSNRLLRVLDTGGIIVPLSIPWLWWRLVRRSRNSPRGRKRGFLSKASAFVTARRKSSRMKIGLMRVGKVFRRTEPSPRGPNIPQRRSTRQRGRFRGSVLPWASPANCIAVGTLHAQIRNASGLDANSNRMISRKDRPAAGLIHVIASSLQRWWNPMLHHRRP
jgi:hypothetical protein